jgi:PBP1b-binding outer membrane lipoprotein LpoB
MDTKATVKKLSAVVALSALFLVGCDDTDQEETPQDVVEETTESPAPGIPSGPTDPAMPGGSPAPVLPGDEQESP